MEWLMVFHTILFALGGALAVFEYGRESYFAAGLNTFASLLNFIVVLDILTKG